MGFYNFSNFTQKLTKVFGWNLTQTFLIMAHTEMKKMGSLAIVIMIIFTVFLTFHKNYLIDLARIYADLSQDSAKWTGSVSCIVLNELA